MLQKTDIIELSQQLISDKEANFTFHLDLPDATEAMPMLSHDEDIWYKIGRVNMCTHNGTHVEVPYHHLKEGMDLSEFPIEKLIGNLVVLDFSGKKPHEMITLEEMQAYDEQIKKGDILFIRTDLDRVFRSESWIAFPYIQIEGIEWLVQKGINCLGTDGAGIEDIYAHNQPGHVTLFKNHIPLVESLTNLDQVVNGDYMAFILPLPIQKGDASPVRVIAVRKEAYRRMINE